MTEQERSQIINDLRDDKNYYGEMGRRFLSNSDIVTLNNEPDRYGQGLENSTNLIIGDYMHKRILQPHLVKDIPVIDAATRRNKEYTDFVKEHTVDGEPKPIFLLSKEVEHLEFLAHRIEGNAEFVDALQRDIQPFEVEEPMIGEINGYMFKGKADRINRRRGFIADLKTTRSLSLFRSNFMNYGYHSQSLIYSKLFGLPVRFYVIDKETGRLGVYDMSEYSLEKAEEFVMCGLEKLEYYYGDNPQKDIEQFFDYREL